MGMDAFGMRFVPSETIPQQRAPSQKIKEKKMGEIVAALMMLATASATAAVMFMHEHRGHTGTLLGMHEALAKYCASVVTPTTTTPQRGSNTSAFWMTDI